MTLRTNVATASRRPGCFGGVTSLLVASNMQPGTRRLAGITSLAFFVSACTTTSTTPSATSIETALNSQSDYIVKAEVRSRPIRLKVDPGAPFFVLLNDKVAKELRLVGTVLKGDWRPLPIANPGGGTGTLSLHASKA